jgi:uncharacterized RDD family membrane protein YckC
MGMPRGSRNATVTLQNVIGVPAENSGAAFNSKRCSGCGEWAAYKAIRCDRCGRRLSNRDAAARLRHDLEHTNTLPAAPAAPPPRPLPEPEWKKELQQRLSGYRDRTGAVPTPSRSARRKEPLPLPIRHAAALPDSPQQAGKPELPPPRVAVRESSAERVVQQDVPPPIVDLRPDGHAQEQTGERGRPAPLSIRAIAGMMDVGVALLATGLFAGTLHFVEQVTLTPEETVHVVMAAFLLNLVFYLLCFLLFAGRTAGMSWLGLSVLNLDGEPPAAAQRRSRAFGTLLSLAALGVGFIWAAADEQGLTWHDRMSKTFVALDDL